MMRSVPARSRSRSSTSSWSGGSWATTAVTCSGCAWASASTVTAPPLEPRATAGPAPRGGEQPGDVIRAQLRGRVLLRVVDRAAADAARVGGQHGVVRGQQPGQRGERVGPHRCTDQHHPRTRPADLVVQPGTRHGERSGGHGSGSSGGHGSSWHGQRCVGAGRTGLIRRTHRRRADRPRTVVSRTYVRPVTEAVDVVIDLVFPHRVAPPRLPVAWLTAVEKAAELQRVQQRRAMDTAYEAELIMGLAAQRPATDDPPPGSPGARKPGWAVDAVDDGVSEFFTAELSAVLNLGRGTADYRHARAHTWLTKLPATFATLRAGQLDERRATQLAEVLMHTTPEVAGRVEAALLGEASDLSVARLRARATEVMLRLDAA